MADAIQDALGVKVELVGGGRGIFEVTVDGKVVAKKSFAGFPEDGDVVAAVQTALA